ncbi:MAG: hypothetical protein KGZ51_03730 [Erysipelothrix sp.]|jgi:hypothetical protein|nr:hypothetical protein [Erysipelothrix sp.]
MNNKWIKLVSVLVLGVALYLGTDHLLRPQGIEGDKTITITIDQEVIAQSFSVKTDALTLAELLEELHEDEKLTITFSGSKTDPYGRGLQGINQIKTENMAVGPQWWGYTSPNNTKCISDGFCSGVDFVEIEDGNEFIFTFKGFE